jgi:hypothetical protein
VVILTRGGLETCQETKGFVRNPEGFPEICRGRISPARAGRRAEHVAGGEAQRFGIMGMQQRSFVKEGPLSSPAGEAQREEGKGCQATPALKRTEPIVTDLRGQVVLLGLLNQNQALGKAI